MIMNTNNVKFQGSFPLNGRDLSVEMCELLKATGAIEWVERVYNVRSVRVMKWLYEHHVYEETVNNAVIRGAPYTDVLHYLTDDAHVDVPKNILTMIKLSNIVYLGVLDHLIAHGDDDDDDDNGNLTVAIKSPFIFRYWIDNGLEVHNYGQFFMDIVVHVMLSYSSIYIANVVNLITNVFNVSHSLLIDSNGNSLLHHACQHNPVAVRGLMNVFMSLSVLLVTVHHMQPAVYMMMMNRQSEIVRMIVSKSDVNTVNNDGQSPLGAGCCVACVTGIHDVVSCLIAHGAVVNVFDNDLKTPLHMACDNGHANIVRLLLQHGACVDARDKFNKKPIDCTRDAQIRRLLR